jgi:hypothetical protein
MRTTAGAHSAARRMSCQQMRRALATASIAAVAALWCVLPATAGAATPFTAGHGDGHDLAVGDDGTGHVVWSESALYEDVVTYCRVPPGGARCDVEQRFPFPNPAGDRPLGEGDVQVFTPRPNEVVVVASCSRCGGDQGYSHAYRATSTDNGVSFPSSEREEIGNIPFYGGQASYLPAGDIVLGVHGNFFQAMNQSSPPARTELDLGEPGDFGSVVPVPDTGKVIHANHDWEGIDYAVFTDPSPTTTTEGELNTLANWEIDPRLPGAYGENQEPHLSSGGNGALLTYRNSRAGDTHVGLRRFDPRTNTFGDPIYLDGSSPRDGDISYPNHSQDPGGRIHAVWRSAGGLRYTRSDNGGASFSAPASLAYSEEFHQPRVEAGRNGTGFVVWAGPYVGSARNIRVGAIDPIPDPSGSPLPPVSDPERDSSAPTITGLGVGDSTLTPGKRTTFRFRSSEAGAAVLAFRTRVDGIAVKVKGRRRCVAATKARLRGLRNGRSRSAYGRLLRKQSCKRWTSVGTIRKQVAAGTNTIAFSGRVSGRRLKPGQYRAELTVTDAAGNKSRTGSVGFRVLEEKKRSRR